ncbi:hypothetical protein PHB09_078 [Pseudomonas phage PHB09]|uniref:Uncharacterized protein n=1 Tax=Pseudomonas phage PHB09 TaxID=2867265 RepID=A0AAE8XF56_9CAUD|nr:hypothetical protein QGX10_gp078 [Pseudomonas phage PHB09]UAV84574.1 hypothetical protein PHB09_078 [Pseudomonas phage PHB09]
MITEGQILNMVDELEKRVKVRDDSYSVRVQAQMRIHGPAYIVSIENATSMDQYEVDSDTHEWFRRV